MKNLLTLFLLITLISSLSSQTIIKGNITLTEDWSAEIYLLAIKDYNFLHTSTDLNNIDSTQVDEEGNFIFVLNSLPCHNCLYRIDVRPKEWIGPYLMLGNNRENFALFELKENQELHIKANAVNFSQSFRITNDAENWSHVKLRAVQELYYSAVELFSEFLTNTEKWKHLNLDSIKQVALTSLGAAQDVRYSKMRKLINQSENIYDKVYGLLLLDNMINDIDYYESVLKGMAGKFEYHPYFKQLKENVRIARTLATGSTIPNLILPDSSGQMVELYSAGSNLILIDIWNSTCELCRQNIRQFVKPLYEKFRHKGFVVYSVSLDENREEWIKAIKEDEMNWINVLNDSGGEYDVRKVYKVKRGPVGYLFDNKAQKIIAKTTLDGLLYFVENYYSGN